MQRGATDRWHHSTDFARWRLYSYVVVVIVASPQWASIIAIGFGMILAAALPLLCLFQADPAPALWVLALIVFAIVFFLAWWQPAFPKWIAVTIASFVAACGAGLICLAR